MNADLEFHIRKHTAWGKLPQNIKQQLGQDHREYEKAVYQFSIKNQLHYKEGLVHKVVRGEKRYYEELLKFSRKHLMLYPYHLQDKIAKGLRTTAFAYYVDILSDIMNQEKSYDCLPNFTAADCLRLLGVGRNQYIELMNQCRGTKKFFGVGVRRRNVRELLPTRPVDAVIVEPWWIVHIGCVMEEDVNMCILVEKRMIDFLIDSGSQRAGTLDYSVLLVLYQKGLVYLEVPIHDDDCLVVPTLEGFVMNRVLGDYLETLLYKIFVSIDEHTSVAELANVLQIDRVQVKNAISLFCRLGFAYKKTVDEPPIEDPNHNSWKVILSQGNSRYAANKKVEGLTLLDWNLPTMGGSGGGGRVVEGGRSGCGPLESLISDSASMDSLSGALLENHCPVAIPTGLTPSSSNYGHKLAFLFDSTLTAYLMMGNLSPGLKNHAVTMFEVGKLSDESMENFLGELDRVVDVGEGEARRYFEHAVNLRNSIRHLRHNPLLVGEDGFHYGLDLLRCESLLSLDPSTRSRILSKNYHLLISMAPISYEDRTVMSCLPVHLGPPIPEVNSVWFKLFLYHLTGSGPPSLLLVKGSRLRRLPECFHPYERLLITTWNHDPAVVPASNIVFTVNEALNHNPVLLQGYDGSEERVKGYVTFPLTRKSSDVVVLTSHTVDEQHNSDEALLQDGSEIKCTSTASVVRKLSDELDLDTSCGFVTLLLPKRGGRRASPLTDSVLLDLSFGIPIFSSALNRRVCEQIIASQLLSEANQTSLIRTSRKLILRLLKFISEVNGESETPTEVPLPTRTVLFTAGKLRSL